MMHEVTRLESVDEVKDYCVWEQFLPIVRCLDRTGLLGKCFNLVHDDLYARNIMAKIKDSKTVEITAILDWNSAFFAPYFVTYRAPLWAWRPKENKATRKPADMVPITKSDEKACSAFFETSSGAYEWIAFSKSTDLLRDMLICFAFFYMASQARSERTKLRRSYSVGKRFETNFLNY
jgi:hypothetical protein